MSLEEALRKIQILEDKRNELEQKNTNFRIRKRKSKIRK